MALRILIAAFSLLALVSSARAQVPGLVINEVDYDQIGVDTAEFIEILNTTPCPIPLTGKVVYFVNGSNNVVYTTIQLAPAGTIQPGQYLVIGSASVLATVPATELTLQFLNAQDQIQNGPPDAIAIVDTTPTNSTLPLLLDALSYEGAMTSVPLPGFDSPVSLVNGIPFGGADSNTAPGSLIRLPEGIDTNDDSADWRLTNTMTPGRPNVDSNGNGGTPFVPTGTCTPPCRPDFNGDHAVNVSDIFDFLAAWFVSNPLADFNHSGANDIADIFEFLSAWFAGC